MGKRKTQIDIVIPFFNGSKFIEDALKSAFNQTQAASRVIVVNDGSSPSESKILATMARKYNLSVIKTENCGQSSARNAGVRASRADFICFLDQDDLFLPNHLATLLKGFSASEAPNLSYVFGNLWSANESGQIIDRASMGQAVHKNRDSILDNLQRDIHVLPTAVMVRRDRFLAVGGFDEELSGYEDDDLWIRFFLAGDAFEKLDIPVAIYRRHESNTYKSPQMLISAERFYQKYRSFCGLNTPNLDEASNALANRFRVVFINGILTAFKERRDVSESMWRGFQMSLDESSNMSTRRRLALKYFFKVLTILPNSLSRIIASIWV